MKRKHPHIYLIIGVLALTAIYATNALAGGQTSDTTSLAARKKQALGVATTKYTQGAAPAALKLDSSTTTALSLNGSEATKTSGNRFGEFAGAMPYLTGIYISFHTNDDDKDWDSNIDVAIDNYQWLVGRGNVGYGTVFRDHTDQGPFMIPVAGRYTPADLRAGRLFVTIYPVGNDTWKFRTSRLHFQFSDGSWQAWSWGDTWASQSSRVALHTWKQ